MARSKQYARKTQHKQPRKKASKYQNQKKKVVIMETNPPITSPYEYSTPPSGHQRSLAQDLEKENVDIPPPFDFIDEECIISDEELMAFEKLLNDDNLTYGLGL